MTLPANPSNLTNMRKRDLHHDVESCGGGGGASTNGRTNIVGGRSALPPGATPLYAQHSGSPHSSSTVSHVNTSSFLSNRMAFYLLLISVTLAAFSGYLSLSYSSLQRKMESNSRTYASLDKKTKDAHDKIVEKLKTENEKLGKDLTIVEQTADEYKEIITKRENELSSLKEDLDKNEDDAENLNSEIQELQDELENAKLGAKNSEAELKDKVVALEEERDLLQEKVESLEDENENAKSALAAVKKELEEGKRSYAPSESSARGGGSLSTKKKEIYDESAGQKKKSSNEKIKAEEVFVDEENNISVDGGKANVNEEDLQDQNPPLRPESELDALTAGEGYGEKQSDYEEKKGLVVRDSEHDAAGAGLEYDTDGELNTLKRRWEEDEIPAAGVGKDGGGGVGLIAGYDEVSLAEDAGASSVGGVTSMTVPNELDSDRSRDRAESGAGLSRGSDDGEGDSKGGGHTDVTVAGDEDASDGVVAPPPAGSLGLESEYVLHEESDENVAGAGAGAGVGTVVDRKDEEEELEKDVLKRDIETKVPVDDNNLASRNGSARGTLGAVDGVTNDEDGFMEADTAKGDDVANKLDLVKIRDEDEGEGDGDGAANSEDEVRGVAAPERGSNAGEVAGAGSDDQGDGDANQKSGDGVSKDTAAVGVEGDGEAEVEGGGHEEKDKLLQAEEDGKHLQVEKSDGTKDEGEDEIGTGREKYSNSAAVSDDHTKSIGRKHGDLNDEAVGAGAEKAPVTGQDDEVDLKMIDKNELHMIDGEDEDHNSEEVKKLPITDDEDEDDINGASNKDHDDKDDDGKDEAKRSSITVRDDEDDADAASKVPVADRDDGDKFDGTRKKTPSTDQDDGSSLVGAKKNAHTTENEDEDNVNAAQDVAEKTKKSDHDVLTKDDSASLKKKVADKEDHSMHVIQPKELSEKKDTRRKRNKKIKTAEKLRM